MAQLLDEPHHDGSPLYLPNPPRRLGEQFDVFLRVPHSTGISRVVARQVHDGEPFPAPAQVSHEDAGATWWRATLTQRNLQLNYRFLTDGGPRKYQWVTAAGVCDFDPTDATDFRTSVDTDQPSWLAGTVAYQIFPDRFARSQQEPVTVAAPAWAQPANWDEPPIWHGSGMGRQFFGGDLPGITERLTYLKDLGVTMLYLTPFFPAPSNHRYNASSFAEVDPWLGGDEALIELVDTAHAMGLRVIGDFTTNHTGDTHEWFVAAQADSDSEEARYFFFADHPHEYEGWFGVPTLPKVDHSEPTLRARMVSGEDSPLRRYVRAPFGLDGWRIDVANMTGRHRETDVTLEVARDVRRAVTAERPDAYVVAEHFHDFRDDLADDGWHGVMNYAGFTKPLWSWLAGGDSPGNWLGLGWPTWPQLPAAAVVRSMRSYTAVPWQHLQASMTLVSSHDTARIATITGSAALVEVAVGALMTYPGVPMVWAGDEIGLEGVTGEDARRAFPWHRPEDWCQHTLASYQELIRIRRSSPALQRGSMRWLFADDDRMVFIREAEAESVLVHLARAAGSAIPLPVHAIGLHEPSESETLYGSGALQVQGDEVVLPESGPAVHIWRWDRSSNDVVAGKGGGNHGQSGT